MSEDTGNAPATGADANTGGDAPAAVDAATESAASKALAGGDAGNESGTGDAEGNADKSADKSTEGGESEGGDDGKESKADGEKSDAGDDNPLAWAEGLDDVKPEFLEVANPLLDGLGLDGEGKKAAVDAYKQIRAQEEGQFTESMNKGIESFTGDATLWADGKVTQQAMDNFAALRGISPEAKEFLGHLSQYNTLMHKGLADIAAVVAKATAAPTDANGNPKVASTMYPNTDFKK